MKMNELARFSESESEFSGGKKCKLQYNFNMAAIEKSIAGLFCFEKFRNFQIKAIKELLDGKDVVVCQPTGSGKSLVFLCLPFFYGSVFNDKKNESNRTNIVAHGKKESIYMTTKKCVLVIAPLESLMTDQMKKLSSLGISSLKVENENISQLVVEVCKKKLCVFLTSFIFIIVFRNV